MTDTHAGAGQAPANHISDELLDEFEARAQVMGRMFAARHGEMCGEAGLSASQKLSLKVIGEIGPVRIGEIATLIGIKAPAASALVDALDKRGYIQREADAEDRRVTLVSLSDEGASELAAAEREHREHVRQYLSVLTEDEIRTMIRVQTKLIEAMVSERV